MPLTTEPLPKRKEGYFLFKTPLGGLAFVLDGSRIKLRKERLFNIACVMQPPPQPGIGGAGFGTLFGKLKSGALKNFSDFAS